MNRIKLPNFSRSDILWTVALIILCSLFLVHTLGLMSGIKLDIPFTYDGDGLEYNFMTKTMMETGWWLENPRTGAPGILEMYDYPIGSNLDLIIMKGISLFTGSYGVVMNIYYILGFFLTALCSLYVFRQLGIAYPIGVFGSILYSFSYFHFNRLSHYNLTAYFMIPLMILVILWVCRGEVLFFKKTEGKHSKTSFKPQITKTGIISIFILLITSTHSYYGFFGLLLLATATLWSYSRSFNLIPLLNGIISCILLAAFAILNKIPSILYNFSHGPSFVMSYRYPHEAEVWGLKLIQLLLPTPGHNIPFLADIAQKYTLFRPLVNENVSATLGIIGSIGFLVLLGWIFIREYKPLQTKLASRLPVIDHLSLLSITAVLIGTIGGISAIIAQVFPEIHSYNRISVFIAFFAILTFGYILQLLFEQYKNRSFFCPLFLVMLLCLLTFGIYDQVPAGFALTPGSDREQEYLSQDTYFKQIEDIMPKGASIFILPDIGGFPNSAPPGKIKALDSLKPYLHTHDLRWSYPTMKGRFWDNWQVAVASAPPEGMLDHLHITGFTGLLIDGYGYPDGGTGMNSIVINLTGEKPFLSKDGRYAFFNLTNYMDKKDQGISSVQIEMVKQKYFSTLESEARMNEPLYWDAVRTHLKATLK